MTAVDANAGGSADVAEAPAATGTLAGDPAMLGLPTFIVGSLAFGLVLVGMVPAAAVGASMPVIMAATGVGLLLATVWAAGVGQSAVASVFGIFSGFWISYAVLLLGLLHNWFLIPATAAQSTQELFLTTWLILIVMLTLATLRLPLAYTLVFALIDVALVFVLLGTAQTSTGLLKTGGVFVFAFAAVGMYVFFSAASTATGGKSLPLGSPIMK
jgi:hypothetical protein